MHAMTGQPNELSTFTFISINLKLFTQGLGNLKVFDDWVGQADQGNRITRQLPGFTVQLDFAQTRQHSPASWKITGDTACMQFWYNRWT